ncbi:PhnD/SsuA/transferrin family substrate-binding protein [Profundibacterium mesophilum]|uniref:ABC transporter phosphonate periplasmic substrate-binding proteindomain containing protein n=1 Tax=Profundibacterium mesophilum KAUST100406-0324 TaxID=1037889 RepID=A0A921NYF5_9RHOB|nr:PhnD/SsuA/transferrin family substrate-binding protein [Profundibacterium mesophilum]KAF0675788.1 ABC transporter phosphonate periplasmic substrate-binding proteindomain containing protein [Profundibacterium mesophilum KAUST100406-0324]
MIAALPMYDREQTAAAHDAFWEALREELRAGGVAAPERLSRGGDLWSAWQSPDLLLGQVCSLPYRMRLHGHVMLLGTADYGLPDAPAGHYYSYFVVRAGEDRALAAHAGRRFACNEWISHSGWVAAQMGAELAGCAFTAAYETGSHWQSAHDVAEGAADIAAIDAISWRIIEEHAPQVSARLQILGRTPASPGQAFICAPRMDAAGMRAALGRVIASGAGAPLGIGGLVDIAAPAYCELPIPQGLARGAPRRAGMGAQTPEDAGLRPAGAD